MVWNGLPIGQLWGLCGATVSLLVGTFVLGSWLGNQAGESRLRDARADLQSRITSLETNLKQQEIKALEVDRLAKADAAETAEKIAKLTRSDEVLRMKQRFLVSCFSYYQTKDRDHIRAENALVAYLKEMWNSGKQDMDKNGYYIFHNPDDPTGKCYIMFAGDPVQYQIPPGIKGQVLDFTR
jgi:hypothetical protein